jgi:hypothetical protein
MATEMQIILQGENATGGAFEALDASMGAIQDLVSSLTAAFETFTAAADGGLNSAAAAAERLDLPIASVTESADVAAASMAEIGAAGAEAGATAAKGMDVAATSSREAGAAAGESSLGFKSIMESMLPLLAMFGIYEGGKEIIKSGTDETNKMAAAQADLVQTVKSTGDASGMTVSQLDELSESLSKASTYSKSTTLAGVDMMATFTNVGSTVFPQASQALMDLSYKMGTAPKEAAIQLGKALNDPITGLTSLKRVGVTFSDSQKEVIKQMMATGNMAGAQQVIISELNKEFGGQAAAATTTYAGKIAILKNQMDDFSASIVTGAQQKLQDLGTAFINTLPTLENFGSQMGSLLMPIVDGFVGALKDVAGFITAHSKDIEYFTSKFTDLGKTIESALAPSMKVLEEIAGRVFEVFASHKAQIDNIFQALEWVANVIGVVLVPALQILGDIWVFEFEAIIDIISGVITACKAVGEFFIALPENISNAFTVAWDGIKNAWSSTVNFFESVENGINSAFDGVGDFLKNIFADAWSGVETTTESATSGIAESVTGFLEFIKNGFQTALNDVTNGISNIVTGIVEWVNNNAD